MDIVLFYLLFLYIYLSNYCTYSLSQIAMKTKATLPLDFLVPSIVLILVLNLLNFFHFLILFLQFLIVNFQVNFLNFFLMKLFVLLLELCLLWYFHHLFLVKMHPPPNIKNKIAKPIEYFTDLYLFAIERKFSSILDKLFPILFHLFYIIVFYNVN